METEYCNGDESDHVCISVYEDVESGMDDVRICLHYRFQFNSPNVSNYFMRFPADDRSYTDYLREINGVYKQIVNANCGYLSAISEMLFGVEPLKETYDGYNINTVIVTDQHYTTANNEITMMLRSHEDPYIICKYGLIYIRSGFVNFGDKKFRQRLVELVNDMDFIINHYFDRRSIKCVVRPNHAR